jgi:hypothetical protein
MQGTWVEASQSNSSGRYIGAQLPACTCTSSCFAWLLLLLLLLLLLQCTCSPRHQPAPTWLAAYTNWMLVLLLLLLPLLLLLDCTCLTSPACTYVARCVNKLAAAAAAAAAAVHLLACLHQPAPTWLAAYTNWLKLRCTCPVRCGSNAPNVRAAVCRNRQERMYSSSERLQQQAAAARSITSLLLPNKGIHQGGHLSLRQRHNAVCLFGCLQAW